MKVRYIGNRVEEASQSEVKEEQCEAQKAIKEEENSNIDNTNGF
eukprot:UN08401